MSTLPLSRQPKSARFSIAADGYPPINFTNNYHPNQAGCRLSSSAPHGSKSGLSKSFSNLKDLLKTDKDITLPSSSANEDNLRDKDIKQIWNLKKSRSLARLLRGLSKEDLTEKEQTPLHVAASHGDIPLIKSISKMNPALINQKDTNGWTPLHCAASNGHVRGVFALLEHRDLDLYATTNERSTVLHYLARNNPKDLLIESLYRELVSLVIERGIFVNAQNKQGESPLHSACLRGNFIAAEILLDHNSNCNLLANSGETPLHYAVRVGNQELVKKLTTFGADPRIPSLLGQTPIDVASEYNQLEILELLSNVALGADTKKGQSLRSTDPSKLRKMCNISSLPSPKNPGSTVPMHKDGSLRKGYLYMLQQSEWIRLWFVLKHFTLSYSTSPQDPEPLGCLALAGCYVYSVETLVESMDNCFKLVVQSNSFLFSSESKTDKSQWVAILSSLPEIQAQDQKRRNKTPFVQQPSAKTLQNLGDILYEIPNCAQPERELEKYLLDPTFEAVGAICFLDLEDNVEILQVLLAFFAAHNKTLDLLRWAISQEIQKTLTGPTLFRGVSIASKLLYLYTFDTMGIEYLNNMVLTLITEITSSRESFEIDPNKVEDINEVESNLERLLTVSQAFLDKLFKNVEKCPGPFRALFRHAREQVGKYFPEMQRLVVGGFIFLRFLCPAIVTPEKYGLVSVTPSKEARRALVLVSKILQNLANTVEYDGSKESFMNGINVFITKNLVAVNNFYDNLTEFEFDESSLDVPEHQYVCHNLPPSQALTRIYKFIVSKQYCINDLIGKDPV
eukprot:TRINITY_DN15378_c0_g1_i1.p1 TRINITY_DN15378_c0_g1~~TRINITY_DN15378_c0_g1_i1.p1  ORF type:complete len:793 (-),score=151.24 TRINITY_DN15378_c0_g1_i1:143-2521(-)